MVAAVCGCGVYKSPEPHMGHVWHDVGWAALMFATSQHYTVFCTLDVAVVVCCLSSVVSLSAWCVVVFVWQL